MLSTREVAEIAVKAALKNIDGIDLDKRPDLRVVSADIDGKAQAWVERIPK